MTVEGHRSAPEVDSVDEPRREHDHLAGRGQAADATLRDYQELFELAPDGYLATDASGVIQRANRAAVELLQATDQQLRGNSLIDLVAEEDRPDFRAKLEQFRSGQRDRLQDWKLRLRLGNGAVLYVALTVAAIRDPQRGLTGLRWLLHDVTERQQLRKALIEREAAWRRSEEYFRSLIENTADVIAILNEDGTFRYQNSSIERLLGYTPDELVGRSALDFVHPEDVSAVRAALAAAFQRPGVAQSLEARLRHRDGSWRIFEAIGKRPAGPAEMTGIVVNSRDVTERKRIEEAARQRQAELSYLLRLSTMGEMATGFAHELNQPLAAIANYAKGCARRISMGAGAPTQILPALEEIAAQAMRAGDIIRQLRNFVRRGERRRETVNLNELAREVARFVEAELREHGARMDLKLAPEVPVVCVDAIQIEQVILNLVRNGAEAVSGVDPARRQVLLRTTMNGADSVEVAVSDTGEGLPREIADRMFDPFFSTKAGALGMGLSISRSIVEAHGGRLWATRNPEHGSTLRFTLPLSTDDGTRKH